MQLLVFLLRKKDAPGSNFDPEDECPKIFLLFLKFLQMNNERIEVKKVKLSLCLNKYYVMKTWGSGGGAPRVYNLTLNGGECLASRTG
jgi:hypothetical protein